MSIELRPASQKVISTIHPMQYRDVLEPTFRAKVKDLLKVQASASSDVEKVDQVAISAEKISQTFNNFLYNHGYTLEKLLFLYKKNPSAKISTATLSELESLHLFITDIVRSNGQVLIEEVEL